MELICNELSYYPIAENNIEAEDRFNQLLLCFKEANASLGFKTIRFHTNFAEQNITNDKNFFEWISTVSNTKLKNTILSFFRKPFADDLNDEELESFLESDYVVAHEDVPTDESPVGLPIAHIKSTITLSFNSHPFWQKRKINIRKTKNSETENLIFTAYNICLETDLKQVEIIEWTDNVMSNNIETKDLIVKYLGYSKYGIELTDSFFAELLDWKKNNIETYKYTLLLMRDVEIHPFTGGMGQTENLKNRGKEASKRISNTYPDGHRLSYILDNNTVKFVACNGHYKFH